LGPFNGGILRRYLKYALLAQFYFILALVYYNVLPTSFAILGESGILFVCGLLLLVYRGLVSLLQQNRALTCTVASFVAVLTVYMWFKNATFTTYFFDLGNFEQPLYMTLFGHQFFALNASPNVVQEVAYHVYIPTQNTTFLFTAEFSPMLILLLPFYAIYPSPMTLALLQNLALALPALLIYRMVEDEGKRLWVSLLYLGYAPLYFAAIWDFHTEVFFPLFLFLAVFFMKSNVKWFLASAVLFLSVNQAGPVLLVFFLPFVYQRTRNVKLVVFLGVMAITFVAANYAVSGYFLDSRLAVPSGGGIGSAVLSGIGGKAAYVALLLAPLLFVPVLSPLVVLPAGAWLAYAFLSNAPAFTSMPYQYSMIPAGFLFLGLVGTRWRVSRRHLKVGLVVSLCVFAVSWPWGGNPQAGTALPYSNPAYQRLDYYLQQIPANATVMASDSVFPHLANRLGTYFDPSFPPQWIVLYKNDSNLVFQEPYVRHYMQVASYTILEDDSLLLVARMNVG
jgi:uncharacterized membrane protein